MSSATKPNLVIFPGAFHPSSCVDSFVKSLQSSGFPAEAHTLRSVGNPDMGVDDDESYMRARMQPHVDAGKDVVLIVHSYAGFPGAAAIGGGIDKRSREAKGEKGGVLGVIYLAAFVPLEGDTVHKLLQNKWEPWMIEDETSQLIYTKDQDNTFYNDCDTSMAAEVTKTLKGHAIRALRGEHATPSNIGWSVAGYNGRRGYVRCLKDNALPLFVQELFTDRSGVEWHIKTLEASHSPFMSMPDETVKVIGGLVDEFYASK